MPTIQADASIGFKPETTYGTAVTVDRFLEFTDESLDRDANFYQGQGLRPGARLARSGRRVVTRDGGKGDITLEVPSKGLGTFLQTIMGVGSSNVVSGALYQQLFTLAHTDYLPSATIQKGIPRLGANTVDAITFKGAECESFELSLASDGVLQLKSSWRAKQVDTSVAYATPSYPTPLDLFSFAGAALTIGGTVTAPTTTALASGGTAVGDVRDFSISVDQKLDDNKPTLGSAGLRGRRSAVGIADVKGKITVEYDATTMRDAYMAQTGLALVATFVANQAADITVGNKPTLQVVIPNLVLEGELPKSNKGDVITQSIDFTVLDNLVAAEPLYIVTRTSDTAL